MRFVNDLIGKEAEYKNEQAQKNEGDNEDAKFEHGECHR
jgi:hypothetical protein